MIITDAWLVSSGTLYLIGRRLVALLVLSAFVVMLLAAGLYHWVFLKGTREGWPVIGSMVRLVVKDEFAQRVSGLAGVNPSELNAANGQGGVMVLAPPPAPICTLRCWCKAFFRIRKSSC